LADPIKADHRAEGRRGQSGVQLADLAGPNAPVKTGWPKQESRMMAALLASFQ